MCYIYIYIYISLYISISLSLCHAAHPSDLFVFSRWSAYFVYWCLGCMGFKGGASVVGRVVY